MYYPKMCLPFFSQETIATWGAEALGCPPAVVTSLNEDIDTNSVHLLTKDAFQTAETTQILTNWLSLEHNLHFEVGKTQDDNGVRRQGAL